MRFRLALPVALVCALALVATAAPVRAQTSTTDKEKQLNQQILEAGSQETAALQELQAIRDRKAPIDARVAELDASIAAVNAKLAPLEADVERLAAEYDDAQAKLAAKQVELDAAKAEFDESAASIYRSARNGATYDYISAARPKDLVQGSKYLDQVNQKQDRIVHTITVLRDDMDAQRKALAASKAQADAAAGEVEKLRDEVVGYRNEIEPARAQAAQEAANEEAQLAKIHSNQAEYGKELAELQAVSDSIGAQLRNGNGVPGSVGGCQFRPVNGAIVSGFGYRTDPIAGGTGFHSGLDMAASMGTPIRACRGGTVVIASWQGGYGNATVIDHGGGMATLYGHQSQFAVTVGQTVVAGQIIGYVGSTGNSTGPHLHFEVRISGNPVDPTPYL